MVTIPDKIFSTFFGNEIVLLSKKYFLDHTSEQGKITGSGTSFLNHLEFLVMTQ